MLIDTNTKITKKTVLNEITLEIIITAKTF